MRTLGDAYRTISGVVSMIWRFVGWLLLAIGVIGSLIAVGQFLTILPEHFISPTLPGWVFIELRP